MKQNEMKNAETANSLEWEAPILDEIDVALLTQSGGASHNDGIVTSS